MKNCRSDLFEVNNYFRNIGQKLNNNIPHTNQGFEKYLTRTSSDIIFIDISQYEVLWLLTLFGLPNILVQIKYQYIQNIL